MKISCPACSAKYSIADDKVQDRLAKIRCRKCGATIVIDGKTAPPHVYTTQGEATDMAEHGDAGGPEYSVDFGEGDQRTLTVRELVSAYNSGSVTGETYVWSEGFTDWKPLADVPEIVDALNAPASSAGGSAWASKPTASAPRSAARSAGNRSATADLFGGIDSAGSEDDVATSAPEHPPTAHSSSTSSAVGAGSATGARNESSVLFSLSALTSAAQTSRPSTRPSSTTTTSSTSRDDSGLIDLKALTAAAMKSDAGTSAAAAPLVPAVAPLPPPLGVAPPLGVTPFGGGITATTDIGYPQQKSKAPLYVGGGIAIGLIAVALAILLKPPPPPPVVAAPVPTMPVAPAPTPTTQPTEAAPEAPTDEPAPTASASKPPPRSGVRRPSGGGVKKPAPGGEQPAATPAKPAAPRKTPCGCAPGDLQCAMRCAAKGG